MHTSGGNRLWNWPFSQLFDLRDLDLGSGHTAYHCVKADVKQMIYIEALCKSRITAEPLYNTPLFIGPYAAANNTALLAWRPSQSTKRGTLGVNNLPRVVARIMPQSESNPRPLDHESSNALLLHHRVTNLYHSSTSIYTTKFRWSVYNL